MVSNSESPLRWNHSPIGIPYLSRGRGRHRNQHRLSGVRSFRHANDDASGHPGPSSCHGRTHSIPTAIPRALCAARMPPGGMAERIRFRQRFRDRRRSTRANNGSTIEFCPDVALHFRIKHGQYLFCPSADPLTGSARVCPGARRRSIDWWSRRQPPGWELRAFGRRGTA